MKLRKFVWAVLLMERKARCPTEQKSEWRWRSLTGEIFQKKVNLKMSLSLLSLSPSLLPCEM